MQKILSKKMSDFARFDIHVDEVLIGKAPKTLPVTWDNSTFGEPEEMLTGPFLIGLRKATSQLPPLRGPSATVFPNPDPTAMTVLQAPCSNAFIIEVGTNEANAIRGILDAR
ncbi:hypothetical protein [Ensifer sp. Root127]|uniref:hypothetical protein n=1 Tax=Ensifer sp. Root127 TaxID=1736440 RepID=UPI0012E3CFCB|nr:hypothetical protein [Ensifer sp. Root127]